MRNSFHISLPLRALVMIATLTFVSAGIYAQDGKAAQSAKPAFTLRVVPVEPNIKAGSKVLVDITLQNISGRTISSEGAWGGEGFEYPMHVWDEKGILAPETRYGRLKNNHETAEDAAGPFQVLSYKGVNRALGSGKSLTDRVNVTYVYDLSKPGKYTIEIEQYDDESKNFVKSNKVTVIVTP